MMERQFAQLLVLHLKWRGRQKRRGNNRREWARAGLNGPDFWPQIKDAFARIMSPLKVIKAHSKSFNTERQANYHKPLQ